MHRLYLLHWFITTPIRTVCVTWTGYSLSRSLFCFSTNRMSYQPFVFAERLHTINEWLLGLDLQSYSTYISNKNVNWFCLTESFRLEGTFWDHLEQLSLSRAISLSRTMPRGALMIFKDGHSKTSLWATCSSTQVPSQLKKKKKKCFLVFKWNISCLSTRAFCLSLYTTETCLLPSSSFLPIRHLYTLRSPAWALFPPA